MGKDDPVRSPHRRRPSCACMHAGARAALRVKQSATSWAGTGSAFRAFSRHGTSSSLSPSWQRAPCTPSKGSQLTTASEPTPRQRCADGYPHLTPFGASPFEQSTYQLHAWVLYWLLAALLMGQSGGTMRLMLLAVLGSWVALLPPVEAQTPCKALFVPQATGQPTRYEWSGACVNGFASGYGTYAGYINDRLDVRQVFSPETGVIMIAGRMSPQIDPHKIQVELPYCVNGVDPSFDRKVWAKVPKETAVWFRSVGMYIIDFAHQKANGTCPPRPGQETHISIGESITCFRYDPVGKTCRGMGGYDSANAVMGWRAAMAALSKKEFEERRAVELERAKRQVQDAQEVRRKYLLSKHGAETFVPLSALMANPFPHDGKKVAVRVQFKQMRSASVARFDDGAAQLVLTDVPSTRFKGGEYLIVFFHVTGTTTLRTTTGGELVVPTGRFADAFLCEKIGCHDVLE